VAYEVKNGKNCPRVRINVELKGDPAVWFREWKDRGLVSSCRDAVVQSFRIFKERIDDLDLKSSQLKTLQQEIEE